jgi:hypothetical protein
MYMMHQFLSTLSDWVSPDLTTFVQFLNFIVDLPLVFYYESDTRRLSPQIHCKTFDELDWSLFRRISSPIVVPPSPDAFAVSLLE